jgi:SOS-response transcriptional repressor LexA
MPAAVAIPTRRGQFSVVQADLPGRGLVNLGVLLQDPDADRLLLRFRRDWESLVDPEETKVFSALAADLTQKSIEMGPERLFGYLESTLSGTLRITDREPVLVENFDRALGRLYHQHVASEVLQFRTHLPRYTLRAAAGKFLDNQEIVDQDWVETPPDLKLTSDMFVAQIAGHSMEPLIPDGSLCVFRRGVVGSRDGRLVLVEDRATGAINRYTVKRYRSDKSQSEDTWQHTRIWLEPLNRYYDPIELEFDDEKHPIIAEFVRVLE